MVDNLYRFFFAGDTHGSTPQWRYLIRECKNQGLDTIYQCGDFGYWEHTFKGQEYLRVLQQYLEEAGVTAYWIDGNHENHELLRQKYGVIAPGGYEIRPNIIYQSRGSTKTVNGIKLVFCGGAVSIDKDGRTPGSTWWPEEEVTYTDIDNTIKDGMGCDILVTHDAPLGDYPMNNVLNEQLGSVPNQRIHQIFLESYGGRKAIAGIVEAIKPRVLVHGHYHHYHSDIVDYGHFKTKIIGLNMDGTGKESWEVVTIGPASN